MTDHSEAHAATGAYAPELPAPSLASRRWWWSLFGGTLVVAMAVIVWWVATFEPIPPVWEASAGDSLRIEIRAARLGLDASEFGAAAIPVDAGVAFVIEDSDALDALAQRVMDLERTWRVTPRTADTPFARLVIVTASGDARHWGDLYAAGFVQLPGRPPMAFAGLVELLERARREATTWFVQRPPGDAWVPLDPALVARARSATGPVVHELVRDEWPIEAGRTAP